MDNHRFKFPPKYFVINNIKLQAPLYFNTTNRKKYNTYFYKNSMAVR